MIQEIKKRLTPCYPYLWHRHPLSLSHSQEVPGQMTHIKANAWINIETCFKHEMTLTYHYKIQHAWFVPVSRLTSGLMPPHLRVVALLAGIWANSPRAPTTLTSTSSGWSVSRPTRISKVLYSWNLPRVRRGREAHVISWTFFVYYINSKGDQETRNNIKSTQPCYWLYEVYLTMTMLPWWY